jgi:dUTP pyrophosphatase
MKREVKMIPKVEVKIKKISPNAVLPTYGTENATGADLSACLFAPVTIDPGQTFVVKTGLTMEIPEGYVGLIYARSGLATKRGLAPSNKVGVIDSDYRGEIMVALYNQSELPQKIEPGERIAQLVIAPYLQGVFNEVDELSDTTRGAGGFGSTGA